MLTRNTKKVKLRRKKKENTNNFLRVQKRVNIINVIVSEISPVEMV
jgi:hypothetical protein